MSLSVLPFSLQLPPGYSLSAGTSGTANASTSSASSATKTATANSAANPVDVVSISNTWNAGSFTANAGDIYRLSDLLHGQSGTPGTTPAGYRVALGVGDGTLTLNGVDVTSRINFTANEFSQLQYTVGTTGSQNLVVVAQAGKLLSNGALSQVVDSPAMQITADVTTGGRSINAMSALVTDPTGADANVVGVVKEAAILTGVGGSARPSVQTTGNFTAEAGDFYRLSGLFNGQTGTPGTAPDGYRVALGAGDGTLMLNGADVTSRTSFTAGEFSQLQYTVGTTGPQNLVVVAQTGKLLSNGTLTQVVDSPPVQITATVSLNPPLTGSRSINAMSALVTTPSDADAAIVGVVKEAAILTGVGGSARPTVQTAGNFTAEAGDIYRLCDLFNGQAGTSGTAPADYRIALSAGDGTLMLNGLDVTSRTSFTASEFAQLQYTAGATGSQNLVVVAQTGKLLSNGTLSQVVDSTAVQITATVSGSRSINAMSALITTPVGADANVVSVVDEASILTGVGTMARPTLRTTGNFTAEAGDVYRLSDLFNGQTGPPGTTPAGYRLALGEGDGTLMLNGVDVTSRTSFTANEFSQLQYTVGTTGSQSLVVVAQTGKLLSNGTLSQVVDSAAVQITATVSMTPPSSGSRSINAMSALVTTPSGADANVIGLVKEAAILTGVGTSVPSTMQTVGNFTADAGDVFRLSDLFQGKPPAGTAIAGYRLALGDGGGAGDGTLMLNGIVTSRTSFTASEFAQLTYAAGTGGSQSLVAVAQTGKLLSNGTLSQVVDSPAVQITASVTGSRSINAMSALVATPAGADANVVSVVKEAAILTGLGGSSRPTVQSAFTPQLAVSPAALSTGTGAYDTAGLSAAGSPIDLSPFDPTAIGSSVSPSTFSNSGGSLAVALFLLDDTAIGAFQTSNHLMAQSQAIKAYSST